MRVIYYENMLARMIKIGCVVCIWCVALVLSSGAQAMRVSDPWDEPVGFLREGRQVVAPKGFLDFCERHPEDCLPPSPSYHPAPLTTRRMKQLNEVNEDVNTTIFFNSDFVDRWDYPEDNIGDCEDIVIEKRRRLMDLGWPEESLLITIVRLKEADFANRRTHAVLTARTAQGDYILDNEIRFAVPWTTASRLFDYVMIQTEADPRIWAMVDTGPLPATHGATPAVQTGRLAPTGQYAARQVDSQPRLP